jgi:hypothetical protein
MDEQCVESSAGHVMEGFRKRMRIAARAQMRSSSSIRMDGHRQTHALFKDDDASRVTNRSPAPSRCCATATGRASRSPARCCSSSCPVLVPPGFAQMTTLDFWRSVHPDTRDAAAADAEPAEA